MTGKKCGFFIRPNPLDNRAGTQALAFCYLPHHRIVPIRLGLRHEELSRNAVCLHTVDGRTAFEDAEFEQGGNHFLGALFEVAPVSSCDFAMRQRRVVAEVVVVEQEQEQPESVTVDYFRTA